MLCAYCGTDNRAGRLFCLRCGKGLAAACPSCGTENEPEALFCGKCGTALTSNEEAITPTSHPQPSSSADVSERRLVSVVFVDLVGFTAHAEQRDAEEVRETLARYFDVVRSVVERHGGTVEKFIGDAAMAVWGTPTAHEDDAERAVRAALELVDSVPALGTGMQARAGVLTGEAAVNVGATEQGMIAGDLVNTAARLQSAAPPGSVLVGESTMHAASAAISFESAGEQALKGKGTPVPAWQALRVIAQRRGAGRSAGLETPFVGRDEELRILREALHLTGREPRTRLVSITGPAGIGKSRLAWEFEKYIDGLVEPYFVHRGRCPAYGDGVTFWALGEMVRARTGLAENDDEATTRQRVRAAVEEYVAEETEREWIEGSLLTLLGVQETDVASETLYSAWRRFLESVADRGTSVLLLEDLQWADAGLLNFLDHLLDWSTSSRMLVITLARPELFERRPDWDGPRRAHRTLALDPLPPAAMRQILSELVPQMPDSALDVIVRRADGIPLYAVETVRMLLADGRIKQVNGSYRPDGDLAELQVPQSLHSLIASRLDSLDTTDRTLLQAASVLGQTFTAESLADVASMPVAEVHEQLRRLVRRELLTIQADPSSPERGQYGFTQSLIREVAYATLGRAERRARHLAAARHFEATGGDQLAAILAEHYLAARQASPAGPQADAVGAQARVALRAAADRAAGLGSHGQAATFLEQALALTDDPAERAAILERKAVEESTAGRYDAAETNARAAIEPYRELGDTAGAARTYAILGTALISDGRIGQAIAELEKVADQLPDEVQPEVRAQLLAVLARALYRGDQAERSLARADEALRIAERLGMRSIIASALASKGTALQYLLRNHEALVLLRGAMKLAQEEGDLETHERIAFNIAGLVASEDAREALEIARGALALAERRGTAGGTYWQLASYAIGVLVVGEPLAPVLERLDAAMAAELADADRFRVAHAYTYVGGVVGRDVSDTVEWMAGRGESDPDRQVVLRDARAGALSYAGDWVAAAAEVVELLGRRPDLSAEWPALRAALSGDRGLLERALSYAEDRPSFGRGYQAMLLAARAGLAALDGDRATALAGFREALRTLRVTHDRWTTGEIGLLMLRTLGADDPEARAAGDEAIAIFDGMGAVVRSRQVRAALIQPAATGPA